MQLVRGECWLVVGLSLYSKDSSRINAVNQCKEDLCLPGPVWHYDSQKLYQGPLCHSNGKWIQQRWLLWMGGGVWMLALLWIHLRSCLALVSAYQQSVLCLNWPLWFLLWLQHALQQSPSENFGKNQRFITYKTWKLQGTPGASQVVGRERPRVLLWLRPRVRV